MEHLSFQTTFLATLQILLMGLCGYAFFKGKMIDEQGLRTLSGLSINVFWPCFVFYQLTQNFDFKTYAHWWSFPVLSFSLTLLGLLVAGFLLVFCKCVSAKKEFIALAAFQNSGFIPLLLVTALFSPAIAQKLYVTIFLFLIGFDLSFWSLGVWLLARQRMKKFELKSLVNSPILTICASLLLIALGLQKFIPQVIINPVKLFSGCALPMAMIITGGNLAAIEIFGGNKKAIAWALAAKLLIMPALALGVVLSLRPDFLVGFLIVLQASVPSAMTLSVIARHYRIEDDRLINQGVFFSHVFSVVTIPIFLMLYAHLRM